MANNKSPESSDSPESLESPESKKLTPAQKKKLFTEAFAAEAAVRGLEEELAKLNVTYSSAVQAIYEQIGAGEYEVGSGKNARVVVVAKRGGRFFFRHPRKSTRMKI